MFKVDKSLSRPNIPRTIRFTEEIYNDLMNISDREDVSFNALVLQCCKHAMEEYNKGKKKEK